jgi:hypothetical protein
LGIARHPGSDTTLVATNMSLEKSGTLAADIYQYGHLLWTKFLSEFPLIDIVNGIPISAPLSDGLCMLVHLVRQCCDPNPEKRPGFDTILRDIFCCNTSPPPTRPESVGQPCNTGPALHDAIKHGDIEMCRMLVMAGADINEYDAHSRTPLLMACARGSVEVRHKHTIAD